VVAGGITNRDGENETLGGWGKAAFTNGENMPEGVKMAEAEAAKGN